MVLIARSDWFIFLSKSTMVEFLSLMIWSSLFFSAMNVELSSFDLRSYSSLTEADWVSVLLSSVWAFAIADSIDSRFLNRLSILKIFIAFSSFAFVVYILYHTFLILSRGFRKKVEKNFFALVKGVFKADFNGIFLDGYLYPPDTFC